MRQEKVLTIESIFWDIILKWKFLLIVGVIASVLLGSAKFVLDMQANKNGAFNGTQLENLTDEEMLAVKEAQNMREALYLLEEYGEFSVRVNVDGYSVPTLRYVFNVGSEYVFNYMEDAGHDYSEALGVAYYDYVYAGELTRDILAELNLEIDEKYLDEAVSVKNEAGIVEIKVIYNDMSVLEQIKLCVENSIAEKEKELNAVIGKHSIKVVSSDIYYEIDKNLLTEQKNYWNELKTYKKDYNSLITQLSDEQMNVFNSVAEENDETRDDAGVQISVKFLLLGFVIGIVLAVVIIIANSLFSSRIQRKEEISDLYNIRLIGNILITKDTRGFIKVIDTWLQTKKNSNRKVWPMEQQVEILAANVEMTCKNKGLETIFITGTELEKIDNRILSGLEEKLTESRIKVVCGDSVCGDIRSLKKMIEMGNVLFVEQVRLSLYDEVEHEIKIAKENDVTIIGCISIECN